MITEILEIKYLGYTLGYWLLINFSLGAVWAFLRLFNVGLVRYIWHLAVGEDYPLIIEPDAEDIDKYWAMIIYFLFGLPKTIIFFIVLASGVVFVAGLAIFTAFAYIIMEFIPCLVKWVFIDSGRAIKWVFIRLKQIILRFAQFTSAIG